MQLSPPKPQPHPHPQPLFSCIKFPPFKLMYLSVLRARKLLNLPIKNLSFLFFSMIYTILKTKKVLQNFKKYLNRNLRYVNIPIWQMKEVKNMDEKLAEKILNKFDLLSERFDTLSEGFDTLSERFGSLQTNIMGEISELKANQIVMQNEISELKANQIVMQNEISDLKIGQAIMQDEIKGIKRGQTVILRSVTQMKKDIIGLKHTVRHLDERIDAVLMDVETIDEKTESLKIVQ